MFLYSLVSTLTLTNAQSTAKNLQWIPLDATSGGGPGQRRRPAVAMDNNMANVLVFGGRDAEGVDQNDVWYFDIVQAEWVQLAFSTDHPSAPAARFDAMSGIFNGVLWISSGQGVDADGQPVYFADLWGFDLVSSLWFQIDSESTLKPAGRWGLAGGVVGTQFVITHGFATERFSDTWSFDLSSPNSTQWFLVKEPVENPVGRCLMAVENSLEELLMFGGCASPIGPCPLADLWGLDMESRDWTQYADAPLALNHADMAFWPGTQDIVLVGGESPDDASRNAAEVLYWNREDNVWTTLSASNDYLNSMPPAVHHRMVAFLNGDDSLPKVILAGGENVNGSIWGLFGSARDMPDGGSGTNPDGDDSGAYEMSMLYLSLVSLVCCALF